MKDVLKSVDSLGLLVLIQTLTRMARFRQTLQRGAERGCGGAAAPGGAPRQMKRDLFGNAFINILTA